LALECGRTSRYGDVVPSVLGGASLWDLRLHTDTETSSGVKSARQGYNPSIGGGVNLARIREMAIIPSTPARIRCSAFRVGHVIRGVQDNASWVTSA